MTPFVCTLCATTIIHSWHGCVCRFQKGKGVKGMGKGGGQHHVMMQQLAWPCMRLIPSFSLLYLQPSSCLSSGALAGGREQRPCRLASHCACHFWISFLLPSHSYDCCFVPLSNSVNVCLTSLDIPSSASPIQLGELKWMASRDLIKTNQKAHQILKRSTSVITCHELSGNPCHKVQHNGPREASFAESSCLLWVSQAFWGFLKLRPTFRICFVPRVACVKQNQWHLGTPSICLPGQVSLHSCSFSQKCTCDLIPHIVHHSKKTRECCEWMSWSECKSCCARFISSFAHVRTWFEIWFH